MRKDSDYCLRCGNPIEIDMIDKTDICGSCADELRAEADAEALASQADAEREDYAHWQYEQEGDRNKGERRWQN